MIEPYDRDLLHDFHLTEMMSTDAELVELKKRADLAPDNQALREQYFDALGRRFDHRVLARLLDLKDWNEATEIEQDAAIANIAKKLRGEYQVKCIQVESQGEEKNRLAVFRHARSGLELSLVPGKPGEPSDEGSPLTAVAPLLVARSPVTFRSWAAILKNAPPCEDPTLPVQPSWKAAQGWLEAAGGGLRLPNELEWEWCARGNVGEDFVWSHENSGGRPHAMEEHEQRANAFGLVDAWGNVREFCAEAAHPSAMLERFQSPRKPLQRRINGELKYLTRGGSYRDSLEDCLGILWSECAGLRPVRLAPLRASPYAVILAQGEGAEGRAERFRTAMKGLRQAGVVLVVLDLQDFLETVSGFLDTLVEEAESLRHDGGLLILASVPQSLRMVTDYFGISVFLEMHPDRDSAVSRLADRGVCPGSEIVEIEL